MTTGEIFAINQEINTRLSEMETGDAEIRRNRHKDIIELVTKLCIALVGDNKNQDISVI